LYYNSQAEFHIVSASVKWNQKLGEQDFWPTCSTSHLLYSTY